MNTIDLIDLQEVIVINEMQLSLGQLEGIDQRKHEVKQMSDFQTLFKCSLVVNYTIPKCPPLTTASLTPVISTCLCYPSLATTSLALVTYIYPILLPLPNSNEISRLPRIVVWLVVDGSW